MLADAWGRSMTKGNSFIPKHPLTSPTRASSCQGGSRGFDPRFPLQTVASPAPRDLRLNGAIPLRGFAPAARASSLLGDFARRERIDDSGLKKSSIAASLLGLSS